MLIDWFTVAAQLVNFAILVWLLKRFLYRPVLAAMSAREQHVRETVAAAERERAEAEEQSRQLNGQREALEQQKAALLEQARAEAGTARRELLAKAREEAESRRLQWRESLEQEWRSLRDELTHRTQDEAFAVARKALHELAGEDLEERITRAFLHQLEDLDEATRARFASGGGNGAPLVVRSRFHLPEPLRDELRQSLQDQIDPDRTVDFETDPRLVAGIEVFSDGQKIAWSVDGFLRSLDLGIRELSDHPPGSP